MENVHYIWVGPPKPGPTPLPALPRADITGPLSVQKTIGDSINLHFWCMDEDVPTFQAELPGIPVYGIMQALETTPLLTADMARIMPAIKTAVQTLLTRATAAAAIGHKSVNRFKVSIKELFALYLLYCRGGYVLDTGVVKTTPAPFPPFPDLMVPWWRDPESSGRNRSVKKVQPSATMATQWQPVMGARPHLWVLPNEADFLTTSAGMDVYEKGKTTPLKAGWQWCGESREKQPGTDCWMMYSPLGNIRALNALNYWLYVWNFVYQTIQSIPFLTDVQLDAFCNRSEQLIISALTQSIYNDAGMYEGNPRWQCQSFPQSFGADDYGREIHALGVKKYFVRSHLAFQPK
ncbi:MAG: hypothetical protein A3J38_08130 [Gammaproteobacteria bacterium RIFCSPHIGHO2_12_FULL_45_9]|nr:MAG: hypothetical protein A3J38_08130 [Gammaproteobacteria bacterium RIFCSPHIGHO2_12_FULL_45_9]